MMDPLLKKLELLESGKSICHVAKVLTLYLDDAPDASVAQRAVEIHRRMRPTNRRWLIAGTRSAGFVEESSAHGQRVFSEHLASMDKRRDQGLTLWDGQGLKSWSLSIQGAGARIGEPKRASFCQVILPNDTPAALLLDFAGQLADVMPFSSGHAGYGALFDAGAKRVAFNQIYVWAKLYPGLDVEDLNVTLGHVVGAIKGANWLTLLGADLWSSLVKSRGGIEPNFATGVELRPLRHGVVIVAGPEPVLGHRNRSPDVPHYADVERVLSPLKLTSHGEFESRFETEAATIPWLRRFLEPQNW